MLVYYLATVRRPSIRSRFLDDDANARASVGVIVGPVGHRIMMCQDLLEAVLLPVIGVSLSNDHEVRDFQ